MVLIYTVRVETESGPIEKNFPSRERAELFVRFAAERGLEATVRQHDAERAIHNRTPTNLNSIVEQERQEG